MDATQKLYAPTTSEGHSWGHRKIGICKTLCPKQMLGHRDSPEMILNLDEALTGKGP